MDDVVRFLRMLFRRNDRGRKRKRDPSPCEEDPQKRRRHDPAQQHEEMAAFFHVLDYGQHWMFLACDSCMMISDKYLLAMVIIYFRRAGLRIEEYKQLLPSSIFSQPDGGGILLPMGDLPLGLGTDLDGTQTTTFQATEPAALTDGI
ncbi:speedy protein A-like [Eleutherodactylus coqui]|uniref:speedy protein A-like n=1 Tax=Eleutherodactylus coqui TaxID=57060 RepID=UPI003462A022